MRDLKKHANEFEEYVNKLHGELSEVKKLILKTLWNAGENFPRNWVKSSVLLGITKQKYFDRRIRELHDQMGCDIEMQYYQNEHAYRLKSSTLGKHNPRYYLTAVQKERLFEKSDYRCQICNKKFEAGVKGLQADHKVPLIRGGTHNEDNWQALCNECNVSKRGVCRDCSENCIKCPWAFPEKHGPFVLVRIPKKIAEQARAGLIKLSKIEKMFLDAWDEYEARKKERSS